MLSSTETFFKPLSVFIRTGPTNRVIFDKVNLKVWREGCHPQENFLCRITKLTLREEAA